MMHIPMGDEWDVAVKAAVASGNTTIKYK